MSVESPVGYAELSAKVAGLELANDDLRNGIDSTGIAIVFVDEHLQVRRFTPAARALVPLIASDIGRPLGDVATSLEYPDLLGEAERVLHTLVSSDQDVRSSDGGWYAVQIRPYRTARNTIEGLSIACIDITRTKRAEQAARTVQRFEKSIVQTVRDPLLVLDASLKVLRASRSFCLKFRTEPKDVEGRLVFAIGDGQWEIPRLRKLLERLLPERSSFEDFELDHTFADVGRRVLRLSARKIEHDDPGPDLILLEIEDVTSRRAPEPHDRE